MKIICPEQLAGKLETGWLNDSNNYEGARSKAEINELLWFLQHRSKRDGGIERFVGELIDLHPDKFVSEAMTKAGKPTGQKYTFAQCIEVWKYEWENDERFLCEARVKGNEEARAGEEFKDWFTLTIDRNITVENARDGKAYNQAMLKEGFERFNWNFLKAEYQNRAKERLAAYLYSVCLDKNTSLYNPTYCADLIGLLFEAMAAHRTMRLKEIAQTEVTKIVFRELEFSISQNVPVPIVGESRIGKSSPALTWCEMRPGRARLVTVPESNRMRDFIEAHADALGLEYNPTTSTTVLTAAVKYVLRHSRLFLAYDEAQFLTPINYHKTTPPTRINFVRCQIIDARLSCSFFATPQSYKQTLDNYVKTTGYRVEQWLGRIAPTVILPADLGTEDLMAIARLHFPDLAEPFLKLIAGRAMGTEGYIKNVEITAKRARFIGQQNGRSTPNLTDVKEAIEFMMPGAPQASIRVEKPVSTALQRRLQRPCTDVSSAENDTPARHNLPRRSLHPESRVAGEIEFAEPPA